MKSRAVSVVLVGVLVGCGVLSTVREDLAAMQSLAQLRGSVRVEEWSGAPIVVAVLRSPEREGAPFQIVDFEQLFSPERFALILEPGTYRVVAFVDENRDLEYQESEPLAPWSDFRELTLSAGVRDGLDITISGPPPSADERMPEITDPTASTRDTDIGSVMPLASERFGAEAGRMGALEPTRFMREIGAGIFFLEPHDPARTPVLFVHGISGYPQEFESLVAALDHERFEAWVAQYPSGWDLDEVAARLNRAINELQTTHQLERLCIVAHSMGGVVVRRAMTHHVHERPRPFITGLVTIASPLGGHPGAGAGVAMSPVVLPSWRSLAPTGELITGLYTTPLPEETRYALFFAFDGVSGDGVVPLHSQLRSEAAEEADVVRGFPGTHTGVLRDQRTGVAMREELDRCREPH